MKPKHKFLAAFFAWAAALLPLRLEAQVLSPTDAVSIALQQELGLVIAKNQAEAARKLKHPGMAGMLPSLNLNGNFNTSTTNLRQTFSNGLEVEQDGVRSDNLDAAAELNWTLFDGLGMFYRYQGLAAEAELGSFRVQMQAESITEQVLRLYFEAIAQAQLLEQSQQLLNYLQTEEQLTKERLDLGLVGRQAWLQVRLDLNQEKARLAQAEGLWEAALANLNGALEQAPETPLQLWDSIPLTHPDQLELPQDSLQNNSSLVEARLLEALAQSNLKAWRANRSPQLAMQAGYRWGRSENTGGFALFNQNQGANFGLQLNFPLFQGFQTHLNIQRAKIEAANAQLTLQDRSMQVQVANFRLGKAYRAAFATAQLLTENLNLARENLDLSIQQFELGNVNALELYRARQSYQALMQQATQARLQAKWLEIEWMRRQGRFLPS